MKKYPLEFEVVADGIKLSLGDWSKVLSREDALSLLEGLAEAGQPGAAKILKDVRSMPCA